MSDEQPEAMPQAKSGDKTFWQRYGGVLMIAVGLLAAGGVSYFINAGIPFTHQAETRKSSRPDLAPPAGIVYIDSDKIMADVIQSLKTGQIEQQYAGQIGSIVGGTIQSAAQAYGDRGYVVISRYVLAAPKRDDVTAPVETLVFKRVKAFLEAQNKLGTQGGQGNGGNVQSPAPQS